MHIIQPVSPVQPTRLAAKSDAHADQTVKTPAGNPPVPVTAKHETGDRAVEPAAPPSVLQMQIKAIISEQIDAQPQTDAPDPEGPS